MKDRVPTPGQEGRVKITPESGGAAYYAKLEMADNPTQAGDELNKATLLKDATAALYGLGADAVPDEVLALIKPLLDGKAKIATGSYVGNGGGHVTRTIQLGVSAKVAVVTGSDNSMAIVMAAGSIYASSQQTRGNASYATKAETTYGRAYLSGSTMVDVSTNYYGPINLNGVTYNWVAFY